MIAVRQKIARHRVPAMLAAMCVAAPALQTSAHGQLAAQATDSVPEPAPALTFADAEAVLAALDSNEYAVRQSASAALSDPARFSEADLVSLAKRDGLSLEQRQRLIREIRRRFEDPANRPAIGMRWRPERPEGIVIDSSVPGEPGLLPGFPAHAQGALREGDTIIELEGESFVLSGTFDERAPRILSEHERRRQMLLQEIIFSRVPGDTLKGRVLRPLLPGRAPSNPADPGAVAGPPAVALIDVEIPLGRWVDLENALQLNPPQLRQAWERRMRYLGIEDIVVAPTLATGIGPLDWQLLNRVQHGMQVMSHAQPAPTPAPTETCDAHRWQSARKQELLRRRSVPAAMNIMLAAEVPVTERSPATLPRPVQIREMRRTDQGAASGLAGVADETARMMQELAELESTLRLQKRMAEDRTLDIRQRRLAEADGERTEERINALRQSLQRTLPAKSGERGSSR